MSKEGYRTLISRRQFLKGMLAAGATAMAVDGFFIEPRRIAIVEKTVPIYALPEAFEGFRICQLTDFHHGPLVGIRYINEVVDIANGLAPDITVLTGDYIDDSCAYIYPVVRALGRLNARRGVAAVLGNHDHRVDAGSVQEALHAHGILVIENSRRLIEKDGSAICIAGVGDLWRGRQCLTPAFDGIPPDVPRILLSHNPDYAEEIPEDTRVDLILAGHTHGGQVKIPFSVTPIVPSRYGQKYAGGLVRLRQHTYVYVSRGIGITWIPVRFNCPPEITIIELTRAVI